MARDDYQIGSDVEWLKHSNEELSRLVKKRQRQLVRWRLLSGVLLLAVGWVVYRYMEKLPLEGLFSLGTGGA